MVPTRLSSIDASGPLFVVIGITTRGWRSVGELLISRIIGDLKYYFTLPYTAFIRSYFVRDSVAVWGGLGPPPIVLRRFMGTAGRSGLALAALVRNDK